MERILSLVVTAVLLHATSSSQANPYALSQSERVDLQKALRADTLLARWASRAGDPVRQYEGFKRDLWRSDSAWNQDQEHVKPFTDLGATRKFELLPLIDYFTSDDSLLGENGVSYLIRTDDATILFDVGLNEKDADPSPLLKNMKRLGVRVEEIDAIVISHPHGDHIGGSARENTFSLSSRQLDLPEMKVLTPIPMTYPGLKPVCSREPIRIAKGVATIGIIACPLFFGSTVEQGLAINVEDRGIVIVSGCGHQTVGKMVQRAERIFGAPPYAILGGFHLPMTEGGRLNPYIKYYVTGRLPWNSLEPADIAGIIDLLKQKNVRLVGISGHDSCDSTIAVFKQAFGNSYVDIAVGKKITIPQGG